MDPRNSCEDIKYRLRKVYHEFTSSKTLPPLEDYPVLCEDVCAIEDEIANGACDSAETSDMLGMLKHEFCEGKDCI